MQDYPGAPGTARPGNPGTAVLAACGGAAVLPLPPAPDHHRSRATPLPMAWGHIRPHAASLPTGAGPYNRSGAAPLPHGARVMSDPAPRPWRRQATLTLAVARCKRRP